MTPVKTMQHRAEYTYKSQDGETILNLRCMSEKQRTQVFRRRWAMIGQELKAGIDTWNDDVYMSAYNKLNEMVGMLAVDAADREMFRDWDSYERMPDVVGVFQRIQQVEGAVSRGEEIPPQEAEEEDDEPVEQVPTPAQVEAMTPDEAEELGEN